ncbi:class I SAM-dependent methyltransferase [Patescibacteria group bacterium]|nr:class I SAM-dependent methyltransferase [Patescibacteria group bacterium]
MDETNLKERVVKRVYQTRKTCRLCGSEKLEQVLAFGETPLANAYLAPEQVGEPEPFAPLTVYFCEDCNLVQLRDVVDPEVLFRNYLYVSSTSPTFVAHFADYAKRLIDRFGLTEKHLVIDVGSNDGVLLKPLQKAGVQVLGIDPAKNIAAQTTAEGIETMPNFLTTELAEQIVEQRGPAAMVTANNVFAHTDEVDDFVKAVATLLADDGVFVFEVQYLDDLLQNNLFDIIYHEHVCYYHLQPLVRYFKKQGLEIFDVERPEVHGGSLRVFVQKEAGGHEVKAAVGDLLSEENDHHLDSLTTYQDFAQRISDNKTTLREIIDTIKEKGERVVGYGAPAKATTLMYAFGLTHDDLEYIVDDDTKYKQGRVMPGTHIPIVSPDRLYEDTPEYCLLLAWNFAEPIMANHQAYAQQGGKFIVPVPKPRVV